ncbi:hypothetical protein HK096_010826, partial [Nowakowskiella sp. JEL0078]
FNLFRQQSRTFAILYRMHHKFKKFVPKPDQKPLEKILLQLEANIFPWFKEPNQIQKLMETYKGRGIVTTTGNKHFKVALNVILSLRNVIKCTLPIEIVFRGSDDLSQENAKILSSLPGVTLVDANQIFQFKDDDLPEGCAFKPFAILASSFNEIIFIDADNLFFQ